MARELKPQKVDDVHSPSRRLKVDLMLDRNKLDFFARVGDEEVRAPSIDELRPLAREMAAKAESYTWERVILVEIKEGWWDRHHHRGFGTRRERDPDVEPTGASVEVEFDRVERARSPFDGKWVARQHPLDFEAGEPDEYTRKRREQFADFIHYGDVNKTVLPYSEETWAGLCAIRKAIDELRDKLAALVERKDVVTLLQRAATSKQPLLLTGSKS
jgi:hypothetical protein